MTDLELTELLRMLLIKNKVNTSSKSYEWFEGEALLLGNPFIPTENESNAIAQLQDIINEKHLAWLTNK